MIHAISGQSLYQPSQRAASAEELKETPEQTRNEAAKGDRQAQRQLAKQATPGMGVNIDVHA